MPRSLSFEKLAGAESLYTACKGNLRCVAILLKDGGICLFSPVLGMAAAASESLAEIGPITYLLAPNHYHNKGLADFAQTFPGARLCAPVDARTRLEKVTGLNFEGLERLQKVLPVGFEFVETKGLKTGEVWLCVRAGQETAWCVVDAFCGSNGKTLMASEPALLKTFPRYGVARASEYIRWVKDRICQDQPTVLVPCHGALVQSADLPKRLAALADELV